MLKVHTIKRLPIILLLVAVMLITAACGGNKAENQKQSAWDKIEKKGELTVATSGTLYPASFHDSNSDKLTGYDVEVVREVAKRLGLKVKFVEMGFDGMLTSVNSGKVDLAANDIAITKDREKKFAFSTPYKYSFGSAIVRKSDSSGIHSLEDLKGKKAAGEATTTYMAIARKHGAEEVIYDNATNDQYLRDVSTGRTDVILNDYYLQKLAIAYYSKLNIMIEPHIRFSPSNGGMIMKKDNQELKKKIDGALAKMKEDGTITELSKKFFGGEDVSKKPNIKFSK
ncbi:transporter substrate-binding domain-containing protein [Bacillus sp. FJAT-49736]|uniref:transporter substrate-binding domain-containing protein n=1 Tax=Bacillus sp. FJAT-49736 TaxID=2833582 RepID=UPI001BC90ADA|nr:transporter substrate-binding domain-containing protein [Bacillus sp. FJAT-49736]MBS4173990.1 transporter substrate-binding domain-containing protein [Bacillus sp. FJAT-49736]